MTKKKPTIDDVAALAGVGRTTVSRVLNDLPNVRDEVRERVLQSVAMLDYKVNVQARHLAGGNSGQIALIHASDLDTEPNSYYHAGLELGAMRACAELGLALVTHTVNSSAGHAGERILGLIASRRCDGIIVTPPFSDDRELIGAIQATGCPVQCVSAGPDVRRIAPSIGIDDEAAGYEIGAYLIGLGHRRFGYIGGLEGHVSAAQRFDGFLRALADHGLPEASVTFVRGNFTFRSGIEAAAALLGRAERPTAIVCANDDMAAGAILTAHKIGLGIPRDVSISGFDDTPVSEIVWPPLTTVHQPIRAIGQKAVELLAKSLSEGRNGRSPHCETVPYDLVVRSSTAAPPQIGSVSAGA